VGAEGDPGRNAVSESLRRLAAAHGIVLEHHDFWGEPYRVPDATLQAVLAAMRVDISDERRIDEALLEIASAQCRRCLPPLVVVRSHARPWRIRAHLPAAIAGRPLAWRVTGEAGSLPGGGLAPARVLSAERIDGKGEAYGALDLELDAELPCGYHGMALLAGDAPVAQATLAVAPPACYRPPSLRGGRRIWGASAQVYGLRSARNWGIGDFTDLATLVERWAGESADVVGVNPLHALFPHDPERASPYSPSSRVFLNVLYVDVEAVPEFARCAAARERVGSATFQAGLAALRAAPLVDYAGVAAAKMPILAMLYAQAQRDARDQSTARAAQFEAFKSASGEALRRQALFDALQAHFHRGDPSVWGWPAWPDEYRDPASPAVLRFAAEHAEEVDCFAWLQWQAELQRADVAERARRCGLAVGLYADLAVSIDRGGAEAWAHQELYAVTASVGAPPDAFNVQGQDWGLPPMIPQRLRDLGYAPFLATLRANMRASGALRIDHVMGLLRLYWVPSGAAPAQGAYVRYPFDDLLGLLALESERHRCLVIGEDLGTVPDEVRSALAANDILSYRVLLFERDAAGEFKSPEAYPEPALAVASTHDLPTLAGWWEGLDIFLRAGSGQLGPDADVESAIDERVRERGRLLAALRRAALLPEGVPPDPRDVPHLTPSLARAAQRFLARTPSALLVVQAEDALDVREQSNLPGTTDTHPNWRRKLPVPLERLDADGRMRALAAVIAQERGRAPT
jgi:(1->4)-alpha-D-glucan 1-alpha-D-glucosylmutase